MYTLRVYYCFVNSSKFNWVPFEGTWEKIETYLSQHKPKNSRYVAKFQDGNEISPKTFLRNGTKINISVKQSKVFYRIDNAKTEKFNWVPFEGKWKDIKEYLQQNSKNEIGYKATTEEGDIVNEDDFLSNGSKIILKVFKMFRFEKKPLKIQAQHLIGMTIEPRRINGKI